MAFNLECKGGLAISDDLKQVPLFVLLLKKHVVYRRGWFRLSICIREAPEGPRGNTNPTEIDIDTEGDWPSLKKGKQFSGVSGVLAGSLRRRIKHPPRSIDRRSNNMLHSSELTQPSSGTQTQEKFDRRSSIFRSSMPSIFVNMLLIVYDMITFSFRCSVASTISISLKGIVI